MATVTKKDLISSVAKESQLSTKVSSKAVESFINFIRQQLKLGNEVAISGFGKFLVKDRSARTGVNPQTKEKIEIPATKAPVFRASQVLKNQIVSK